MNKLTIILIAFILLNSCKHKIPENRQFENNPSSTIIAEQKINESGIKEAVDWLEENKKSEDFVLNEEEINGLGYRLLYNSNKPTEASKIFEINIELFPNSYNAYDSAAEGYLNIGNHQKSIDYYRKSIELNGKVQFHQLGYLESKEYSPTILPNDTTKLFQIEGIWKNNVAFVYVQGGPDLQLNIGPRDGLHLMPNHSELLKIYPYQAQMLNPETIACNPMLTAEQSAYENSQSVEILDRVIRYLVAHKKKVYLIGHSYGASISMEYLHSKENLTEKVVLMGLDLDEDISSWKTLNTGEYIRWENGQNPYALTVFQEIPEEHPLKTSFDRVADNLGMIVGNNMAKNYTDLYEDEDFKKLISVYSTQDEANGRKSKEEIAILNQKGSTIIEIQGDHHDMLTTEFMSDLYQHLVNGKSMASKY